VGTVRINLRKNWPLEFENEYGMFNFSPYYPEHVSTTTKFMIRPEHRGSIITLQFASFIYEFWRDNGIAFDFINVNSPLDLFYERLGYRKYKENFLHPEFGEVIPMVLVVFDVEYLRQVQSPFIAPGRDYQSNREHIRFFHERAAME